MIPGMIDRSKLYAAENKMDFINRIISDHELAQCLVSTEPNFKNCEPTQEQLAALPWNQVFPCIYTLDTQLEIGSFITMKFRYSVDESSKPYIWKVNRIDFYVFCHKSLIRTDYGVLRYDYMAQRLCTIMNDSYSNSWYNRLELKSMEDIMMDSLGNFVGVKMTFGCNERWTV